MRVISVQSQVVYGHVGNSAAVFPLEAQGIDVAAVPTTLLSNHPHYPTMHGRVLDADLVGALLQGVEDRGLVQQSKALLTGYLGSVANAEVVADFAARWKKLNPDLIFVCDPVIGDDDLGIFVDPGLPDIFRARLVPLADYITPNQFELELLSGQPARTATDLMAALRVLRAKDAAVTGCVLADTPPGQVEAVIWSDGHLSRNSVTHLPIRPHGTGDLFTSLFVAGLCKGLSAAEAGAKATRDIFSILKRTEADGASEMSIIPWFATR